MKGMLRVYLTLVSLIPMINSCVYATTSYDDIKTKIPPILNAIAWIGYAVSFGMLIYIGIKYMLSAANEKAALKEGSINYLIGVALITSASVFADIVAMVASRGSATSGNNLATQLIDAAKEAAGL